MEAERSGLSTEPGLGAPSVVGFGGGQAALVVGLPGGKASER